jgi:iron complex outermembrane recepter protein
MFTRCIALSVAVSITLLAFRTAVAEQARPGAAVADNATVLEEVVVTARRRAENLQDVPLSVTAFSGEALTQMGITDRNALADFTPSLITITGGYPQEFAFFSLRGQGPAFGATPGVVPYFAEVPNSVTVDGRPGTYYDLANIQVLAGPQGTLFGKNATGGNILFEPQRPTDKFGGYLRAEYGNFNDARVEGAINLPMADGRALLRIAGDMGNRSGYTKDVGPNFAGKEYDNLHYRSARVSLTLKPTDTIELYTVARYYQSDNNGPGTVLTAVNPTAGFGPFLVSAFFPGLSAALTQQQQLGIRQVAYDTNEYSNTKYWQVINQSTFQLNDTWRLKNVISDSSFRMRYGYDYDATIYPIAGQTSPVGGIPTDAPTFFTEELQLQGELLDKAATVTTGAYYDRIGTSDNQGGQFTQFPFSILLGGPLLAYINTHSDSKALFMQGTLDLGKVSSLKGLSVTAGYRYTWEHARTDTLIIAPPVVSGEGDFGYGSYDFSLDYAFSEGVHAYITNRDAYKAGGVNGGVPVDSSFHLFPPEKLDDTEVGLKSQFMLGGTSVRANLAAYRGNYSNIQRTTTEIINGAGLNVTRSAAHGVIQGLELTTAIKPVDVLTLTGSYSYIDSKYSSVTDASAAAILAGSPFPYTPKEKFAVGVTYAQPLSNRTGMLGLSVNYAYQSDFSTAQTNASFIRSIPSFGVLNLSADLNGVAGSPLDISLFATNVANKVYASGDADFYNQPFGVATLTYGEPRMYGLRLTYHFGH